MAKSTKTPKARQKDDTLLEAAGHGVIVMAQNGAVIRYDPSGLVMRLSDKVIADIALRLPQAAGAQVSAADSHGQGRTDASPDLADLLDGVDAWDIAQSGDWVSFTARLAGHQGNRRFRRHLTGGAILADAAGAVYGILGLGGARATTALPRVADFPHHILAPEDDIGAVGHAGIEPAKATDKLGLLREMTHEALCAEALLHWQFEKFEPLRLFVTRVETDQSSSAAALADGLALANLLQAARNIKAAAQTMGKPAKILAVHLDFAMEMIGGTPTEYRDGMLRVMAQIEQGFAAAGLDHPIFVARFDTGSAAIHNSPAIEGQWELGWNHAAHRFIQYAPSYMFALNAHDRPTEAAQVEMAEMSAAAISAGEAWLCPRLYLAERSQKHPNLIRVTARADGALDIDPDDPFGAGKLAGFSLINVENGARIKSVRIDKADPQAILIDCDKRPEGAGLRLAYAAGQPNCGSLRDRWRLTSRTGRVLARYALPALLPITDGGQND